MTDVREQLTEAYQDGWLLAATRELLCAARDLIADQDKEIAKLKTLSGELLKQLEKKNTELEERCLYGRFI
jgi:hypothetical protein